MQEHGGWTVTLSPPSACGFIEDHYIDVRPSQEPEGVVGKMQASLDRAAELLIRQKSKNQWKWDSEILVEEVGSTPR